MKANHQEIVLGTSVSIDKSELWFTYQRSGGPGGQNVNKLATRTTLQFNLADSPSLTAAQKKRIQSKLAGRINREGVLRVVSSKHRTQPANRKAALERFIELMTHALRVVRKRKKTKVPASAKRHRLEEKKRRSKRKQERRFSESQ